MAKMDGIARRALYRRRQIHPLSLAQIQYGGLTANLMGATQLRLLLLQAPEQDLPGVLAQERQK